MAMQFICGLAGFEENWVEMSEEWSRGDYLEFQKDQDETAWLGRLHAKMVACHLATLSGEPVTEPKGLTSEALDRMHASLFGFVCGIPHAVFSRLQALGNVSARTPSGAAATPRKGKAAPTES